MPEVNLTKAKADVKGSPCPWCGRRLATVPHHYPIPRSQGGKQTINICGRCHRLYHSLFFINASVAKSPEEYEQAIQQRLQQLLHKVFPLLTKIIVPKFCVLNPPWMWQLGGKRKAGL